MIRLRSKIKEEVNTEPLVPRLAKSWNQFRPKVENDDPLSNYKSKLVIPFLDDINFKLEYHNFKLKYHLKHCTKKEVFH